METVETLSATSALEYRAGSLACAVRARVLGTAPQVPGTAEIRICRVRSQRRAGLCRASEAAT